MDLGKIEKLVRQCELDELRQLQLSISDLIEKLEHDETIFSDEEGRKLRMEDRFGTNLLGTLSRITDVKPGERKEYSVNIKDVSRSGMRLIIDTNFVPSRLVEITFAGPGGKVKNCFMEIVRMRKMTNQNGSWIDIGCRIVENDEVRRLRLQEEHAAKMRAKLHNRSGILISLVGPKAKIAQSKLDRRIKSQGYSVQYFDSIFQALRSAEKTNAQLAVFCYGSQLCEDPKLLAEIKSKPSGLATMAIIENEEHRMLLIQAGIDECLTEENCEKFLFYTIERALVGHAMRQNTKSAQLSGRILIASTVSTRITLMSYQMEEYGYSVRTVNNMKDAQRYVTDTFDLILADYEIDRPKEFRDLRELFGELPVVALCDDISHGQQSIVDGATNYLCMPPSKGDIRMIMELAVATPQSSFSS